MGSDIAVELVLVVVMIAVNAFFAASEMAIISVKKPVLRAKAEGGNKAAKAVLRLSNKPGHFLAMIQIGVTLAGFFASAIGAVSAVALVGDLLRGVPWDAISANANGIALILVTVIIAVASLLLGELIPKNLALMNAERVALAVARPLEVLSALASPLVSALTATTNGVLKLLRSPAKARVPSVSEEEIRAMVDVAEDEGVVDESEHDMIQGIFDFGETTAKEVMVPRVHVSAISADATPRQAWEQIIATGHSRMPIVGRDLDDVVGLLHAKDLLKYMGGTEKVDRVAELARPVYFVPGSKLIDEVLRDLRQRRTHMAVVVDEYGGTAGVVTLEDILEEIIGPIQDEYDAAEMPAVSRSPGGRIEVDPSIALTEFNRLLGTKVEETEVDTVGGLVYTTLGRVPVEGDYLDVGTVRLCVSRMDGPRIARIVVTGSPSSDESSSPPRCSPSSSSGESQSLD